MRAVLAALVAGVLVAACGGAPAPSSPAPSPTPQASLSGAIALTRGQVQQALGVRRIELQLPSVPYRPAEAPLVAAAPRAVVQAVLPQDPAHGDIVIYEFPDTASAAAAGREQAAYVASGPGRIQFPFDVQFVLRQLGTTVVFYAWSPSAASDPQERDVAAALDTLGAPIPVSP